MSTSNPRKIPGFFENQSLGQKALNEIADARLALFEAQYTPVVDEFNHFHKTGTASARPLAEHLRALTGFNRQVEVVRDAFRAELESLGYTTEQIREIAQKKIDEILLKKGVKTDETEKPN